VAPTILEAAGIPAAGLGDGIQQDPDRGHQHALLVQRRQSPRAVHDTQYFEVMGNRAIYHKGWTAVTKHYTPWINAKQIPLDDDVWELYDTSKDWSQANDLAKEMPDKLRELQRLFIIEARAYKVLPLDDRMLEKINPDTAGRPVLIKGKTQLLAGGMSHLSENCVLNIKNKSHSVTAEIVVPPRRGRGRDHRQGADIGGWTSSTQTTASSSIATTGAASSTSWSRRDDHCSPGEHQVRMEFAYDGGGLGKGGKATLYVDGQKDGEGVIGATLAMIFSADDGCDVGKDGGSAISPDYGLQGRQQSTKNPRRARAGHRHCGAQAHAGRLQRQGERRADLDRRSWIAESLSAPACTSSSLPALRTISICVST
jgi:hypothetical protein